MSCALLDLGKAEDLTVCQSTHPELERASEELTCRQLMIQHPPNMLHLLTRDMADKLANGALHVSSEHAQGGATSSQRELHTIYSAALIPDAGGTAHVRWWWHPVSSGV